MAPNGESQVDKMAWHLMGKVTQLRGNAYSWFVLGTAEMCQIFYLLTKIVILNSNIILFFTGQPFLYFLFIKIYRKKRNFQLLWGLMIYISIFLQVATAFLWDICAFICSPLDRVTRLGNFCQLGSFFWGGGLIMVFGKDEVAQRNGDILGYFCLNKFITFSPVSKHGLL